MKQVAIVTGCSSGIGLCITTALLERDFAVVGVARSATTRTPLVAQDGLLLVDGDVGEPLTAERAVTTATARFGRLDLLVNNAGIFVARPFTDHTDQDVARLLHTNVGGFFQMTRAALVPMLARGAGHVVSISTSLAAHPQTGLRGAMAILTKGGIEAATRALAIEYAGQGIRANAVAAGIIDTPMNPADKHDWLAGLSPLRRLGTVREMAAAVLYLHDATFVTGEVLHVDGGAHAGRW